jgi:hypothetical protein
MQAGGDRAVHGLPSLGLSGVRTARERQLPKRLRHTATSATLSGTAFSAAAYRTLAVSLGNTVIKGSYIPALFNLATSE